MTISRDMIYSYFLFFSFFLIISANLNHILDLADHYSSSNQPLLALEQYKLALQINPSDAYSLQGAASSSAELKQFLNAGKYYEQAAIVSQMPLFYLNAGMAYSQGGYISQAELAYLNCLEMASTSKQCHIKLAELYNRLGQIEKVQQHLLYSLQIDPTDSEAYQHLADSYNNLKQFKLAIETYKKAFKFSKNIIQKIHLLVSLGDTYSNLKQSSQAREVYRKGYQLFLKESRNNPNFRLNFLSGDIPLRLGLLFNQIQTTLWLDYEIHVHQIISATSQSLLPSSPHFTTSPSILSPYRSLFLPISPSLLRLISSSWVEGYRKEINLLPSIALNITSPPSHLLRIGYISRRFEDYPGTQMMLRLFQIHNRSKIHLILYAHGPDDGSQYRQLVREYSDQFHDISLYTIEKSAELIARDDLDVLIDYDGMHDFNSLRLLMYLTTKTELVQSNDSLMRNDEKEFKEIDHHGKDHNSSPTLSQRSRNRVHITWLGFAGTSGMTKDSGISYLMADRIIAPPEHLAGYSEKLIYLPGTYQPQDEYQGRRSLNEEMSTSPKDYYQNWVQNKSFHRRRLVSEHYSLWNTVSSSTQQDILASFWFVCFNRLEKITPDVFEDWMLILARNTKSTLILMVESEEAQRQVQLNAQYFGIPSSRLLFFNRLSKSFYSLTLSLSDLFLDTSSYDAHTTASDGLYTSLPILTRPLQTMSSRVASSLLSSIELSELITYSRREYVDVAIRLSRAETEYCLLKIRTKIYHAIGKSLFNSVKFARKLERGYQLVTSLSSSSRIGSIYSFPEEI